MHDWGRFSNCEKGVKMELIDREKSEMDVNMLSPLTWAYVGDAVYELYVRTNLVNNTKLKPHIMNYCIHTKPKK